MADFKAGDRVKIITREFEHNDYAPHYGIFGTILEIDSAELICVERDRGVPVWYAPMHLAHLAHVEHNNSMDGTDEYDTIMQAQEIVNGL